jgi:hypothetical protein
MRIVAVLTVVAEDPADNTAMVAWRCDAGMFRTNEVVADANGLPVTPLRGIARSTTHSRPSSTGRAGHERVHHRGAHSVRRPW